MKNIKKVLKNQKGQGLSEYGLIIALIAVVSIGALIFLGPKIADKFFMIGEEIEKAEPASSGGL